MKVFYVVGEKGGIGVLVEYVVMGDVLFFCLLICYVWLFGCGEWYWFMNGVEIFG